MNYSPEIDPLKVNHKPKNMGGINYGYGDNGQGGFGNENNYEQMIQDRMRQRRRNNIDPMIMQVSLASTSSRF